jgi:hypothetical protein
VRLRKRYWKAVLTIQLACAGDFTYALWTMPRAMYAEIGPLVILSLVLVLLMAGETWRGRRAP